MSRYAHHNSPGLLPSGAAQRRRSAITMSPSHSQSSRCAPEGCCRRRHRRTQLQGRRGRDQVHAEPSGVGKRPSARQQLAPVMRPALTGVGHDGDVGRLGGFQQTIERQIQRRGERKEASGSGPANSRAPSSGSINTRMHVTRSRLKISQVNTSGRAGSRSLVLLFFRSKSPACSKTPPWSPTAALSPPGTR